MRLNVIKYDKRFYDLSWEKMNARTVYNFLLTEYEKKVMRNADLSVVVGDVFFKFIKNTDSFDAGSVSSLVIDVRFYQEHVNRAIAGYNFLLKFEKFYDEVT